MSFKKLIQGSVFLLSLVAGAAHANLIKNGNFEQVQGGVAVPAVGFVTVGAGSAVIADWTVGPVSVDLIRGAYGAIDGISVDMLGTPGPGLISQAFAVTAGRDYLLTFDLFRNSVPSGTVEVAFTDASNNTIAQQFTSNGSGTAPFSMLYHATDDGPVTLSFASIGGDGFSGAVLDNVAVNAVPEPATLAILAIGLLGAGAGRRRR